MFVRTRYKATHTGLAQRYWTCKHCGAYGEAAFVVRGSSEWVSDAPAEAGDRAEIAVRTDEANVHALIVCPTCGQRAPGAATWSAIRVGLWFAVSAALALAHITQLSFAAIAFTIVGCMQLWRERAYYRRSRGVILSKVQPGELPAGPVAPPRPAIRRQLAPPPDLPQARALSIPAAPVEVVDPSSGPRFLTEK